MDYSDKTDLFAWKDFVRDLALLSNERGFPDNASTKGASRTGGSRELSIKEEGTCESHGTRYKVRMVDYWDRKGKFSEVILVE